MGSINKTLYIPLYGKALVSRKGILLSDKKAEEIWAAVQFPLKRRSSSKWLAYYMGMRAAFPKSSTNCTSTGPTRPKNLDRKGKTVL